MNLPLLLHTPLFLPAILSCVLFAYLSLYVTKNSPKTDPYDKKINPAITASFLLVLGFWYLWSTTGESILWSLRTHDGWLTTEGQIIHSTTESKFFRGASLHYQIRFEYNVDGKLYESDRVSYGFTGSSNESFANEYVAKYPVGKKVLVYYDPIHPQKAVLEPDVKQYDGVLLVLMMLSLEVFFLAGGIAKKRAQQSVLRNSPVSFVK